jgi:hypothetical protein
MHYQRPKAGAGKIGIVRLLPMAGMQRCRAKGEFRLDAADKLMIEYRDAVGALRKALAEAADPALSPMDRIEQVKSLRLLWARHDGLRRKIEAMYR